MRNYSTSKPLRSNEYLYWDETAGSTIDVYEEELHPYSTGILDPHGDVIYSYPYRYRVGFI